MYTKNTKMNTCAKKMKVQLGDRTNGYSSGKVHVSIIRFGEVTTRNQVLQIQSQFPFSKFWE